MVQVRLMIPGGRRMEAFSGHYGVTGLAMRCARYGTENHDAAGLALALDALGSQMACRASLDAVSFSIKSLSGNLETSMGLLSDVLLRPLFGSDETEREIGKIVAAKRQQAKSPAGFSGQWVGQMLYGEHPYGAPASTPEELEGLCSADLHAFFASWVRPQGAVLVMVGDVDLHSARALVERHLGDWNGAAPPIPTPLAPQGPQGREILILDRPGSRQNRIVVGMQAVERDHCDHLALRVLAHIFGGGASGRLFQDLRETRSLTYGCSASLDSGVWGGDVVASLSCSPEKSQEALGALLGQVERICREPVSEIELRRAIQYKVGAWPMSGATLGGLSRLLLAQVLNGLPSNCWSNYPESLRELQVDSLSRAAEKHLSASDLAIVLVGDAAQLESACAGLGKVQIRNADALPIRLGPVPIDREPDA
jgi:zinc protease